MTASGAVRQPIETDRPPRLVKNTQVSYQPTLLVVSCFVELTVAVPFPNSSRMISDLSVLSRNATETCSINTLTQPSTTHNIMWNTIEHCNKK